MHSCATKFVGKTCHDWNPDYYCMFGHSVSGTLVHYYNTWARLHALQISLLCSPFCTSISCLSHWTCRHARDCDRTRGGAWHDDCRSYYFTRRSPDQLVRSIIIFQICTVDLDHKLKSTIYQFLKVCAYCTRYSIHYCLLLRDNVLIAYFVWLSTGELCWFSASAR